MVEFMKQWIIYFLCMRCLDVARLFATLGMPEYTRKFIDLGDWISRDYNPYSKFYDPNK